MIHHIMSENLRLIRQDKTVPRRFGTYLVVAFALIFFATRMFQLISRFAINIFFSDEWKFNDAYLFQKHSLWHVFLWQHGWHRQGVGGVFGAIVEPLFRWNSRSQAFVVGAIIAITTICALWLKTRLYGRLSVFDALIPALFFTPAQYESLLVTPNFAQGAFPLLFTVLFCLTWSCRTAAVRYRFILAINFLATYTGFTLFLGMLTPLLLVVDYRATDLEARASKPIFISALLLALATIGSFFLGYSFEVLNAFLCPSQPQYPLRSYAAYVAVMFANPFRIQAGIGSGSMTTGAVIVIAVLSVLLSSICLLFRGGRNLTSGRRQRAFVQTILTAFSLLLCLNAAHGRACLGLGTAQASRYVICVIPGILGVYFGVLQVENRLMRRVLTSSLLAAIVFSTIRVRTELPYFPNIKQRWKDCYLQREDAMKCDQAVGFPYTHTPDGAHIQEKLRYLKQMHENLYSDSK